MESSLPPSSATFGSPQPPQSAAYDPAILVPAINRILQNSDPSTVSAKAVRKELQLFYPDKDIKAHKTAIDAIIVTAFNALTQNGEEDEDADESEEDVKPIKKPKASTSKGSKSSPAVPIAGKAKHAREETDEEMAQRLSRELNSSRGTRAAAKPAKKVKGSTPGRSSQYIDSDDDDSNGPKPGRSTKSDQPPKKKAKRVIEYDSDGNPKKKKTGGGWQKEYRLSDDLAAVVGAPTMSRPTIVKQLWVYIKDNDLQDPTNKMHVLPDAKLRKIFNHDRIHSFKMSKEIGVHLYDLNA